MTRHSEEEARLFEERVEGKVHEWLEVMQPFLRLLGLNVHVNVCRSAPNTSAYYKSTLDIWITDEVGTVVWMDSLILFMSWEQWSTEQELKSFIISAIEKALMNFHLNPK